MNRESGTRGNKVRRLKVAVASVLRAPHLKTPAVLTSGRATWSYFELVGWDEV